METNYKIILLYGTIFLLFNWVYATAFFGIYKHSFKNIVINVLSSMACTLVISLVLHFFSTVIKYSNWKCCKKFKFILRFVSKWQRFRKIHLRHIRLVRFSWWISNIFWQNYSNLMISWHISIAPPFRLFAFNPKGGAAKKRGDCYLFLYWLSPSPRNFR